ncbi:hypothetical protein [Thauera propionica]|uniref:hypothetical protein n=1 Tax=Thauera propionica TaxID=2019431 RepID=UPI0023F268BE|nr:hypothetical protein [Thauera propionica]MDD3675792.1 hypothetical protein [Thauera propionica]
MKIKARIPTHKETNGCWTRFPTTVMEVEVVRLIRWRADPYRERYYYQADVVAPPEMHPDYHRWGSVPGTQRVKVCRKLNPKWKPPAFPDDEYWLDVSDGVVDNG